MNIIIPLGGLGDRFKRDGYNTPKPLINILGEPMIFHVINGLYLNDDDTIIIIYNKELNNYNFESLITKNYDKCILIEMILQTEGSVQTILYGLDNLNKDLLTNKCVIIDCDVIYNIDILSLVRGQLYNSVFCFVDEQQKPIYSYVKLDETSTIIKNKITDVKEKIKISNYANTGCYCFVNGIILKKYCERIIENDIREKNEFYTTCVIKEMLREDHIFQANIIKTCDFDCVGTPFQLKLYMKNGNNIKFKRFCFDLDNTLVSYPVVKDDYTTVTPIHKNINILKKLKNQGHTIIIYTARRMRTMNGSIGKVIKHIGKITLDTLEQYDIPYDEIYFGKPYADFYIDDLAVNAFDQIDKCIGFYDILIEPRSFNNIEILDDCIKKTSISKDKLDGEIYYYNNIPVSLTDLFPKFITTCDNGYIMEKINGIPLSRLFVKETLDSSLMTKLLNTINLIHSSDTNDNTICVNIYESYSNKIKKRYSEYDYSIFENSENMYNELINYFEDYETNNKGIAGVIHGDPVFSNIILDRSDNFKFIDMRGRINDENTIFGDIFYDYSKIYQSLNGYDEILFNECVSNNYRCPLIKQFNTFIIEKYGIDYLKHIKMITKSLLFTLIPLHNNENIYKFYALISNI